MLADTASGVIPGDAPARRLLVVGESTAVGVGASSARCSLAPQLAEIIAKQRRCAVHWQVIGQNGIRAAELADKLIALRQLLAADVALVLLGANDTSGLSSLRRWRRDLGAVVGLLRSNCDRILIAPVPPFHRFILLPQPLRWLLGERGLALCAARRRLAEGSRIIVLEAEFPRERRYLAADGYHPSDDAYREWSERIAEIIR